jgi:hypothetical protein
MKYYGVTLIGLSDINAITDEMIVETNMLDPKELAAAR